MVILSLIFAIGASGLNIISGYGGYISLGQSAFLGVGAYTVGLLAVRVDTSPVRVGAARRRWSGRCSRCCSASSPCARAGTRS